MRIIRSPCHREAVSGAHEEPPNGERTRAAGARSESFESDGTNDFAFAAELRGVNRFRPIELFPPNTFLGGSVAPVARAAAGSC
jgi:hypothetical protein